eukprot:12193568-Alexandrium_andersonii.AAC.1
MTLAIWVDPCKKCPELSQGEHRWQQPCSTLNTSTCSPCWPICADPGPDPEPREARPGQTHEHPHKEQWKACHA